MKHSETAPKNDSLDGQSRRKCREVLVLCQLFYPELVSTGQTLTELCEELVKLGVDVEVLCGQPTVLKGGKKVPRYIEHKGIRIRRVWGTRFPKLNLAGRVMNQLTFTVSVFFHLLFSFSKKPVLVLTNPPFLAVACAILRVLGIGGPYIYLTFDVYPDTAIRLGVLRDGGVIARVWDRLNTFVFKRASAIVVIGRCMREIIGRKMSRAGLRVDGKLYHIHVWSDDRLISSASGKENPLVAKWGLLDKFVVGYFGNMGRFHDMETIAGAAEILRDDQNIVFLFVGEGHKKQWLMDRARERGLQNCRFHTYVERENLGYVLSLARVGIVSLLDGQEGLSVPSKAYGLMAGGVPVLAVMSAGSEIARMVAEQECGRTIEPGADKKLAKTIVELYNDRHQLDVMSRNAIRTIEDKYSLAKAARQYVDLIAEVGAVKKKQAPRGQRTLC